MKPQSLKYQSAVIATFLLSTFGVFILGSKAFAGSNDPLICSLPSMLDSGAKYLRFSFKDGYETEGDQFDLSSLDAITLESEPMSTDPYDVIVTGRVLRCKESRDLNDDEFYVDEFEYGDEFEDGYDEKVEARFPRFLFQCAIEVSGDYQSHVVDIFFEFKNQNLSYDGKFPVNESFRAWDDALFENPTLEDLFSDDINHWPRPVASDWFSCKGN